MGGEIRDELRGETREEERRGGRIRYLPGVRRPYWHGYTAFILSGGGARGALQAGALRALFAAGIRPDVIVGTSIGAWNGAWIARTPTPEGAEKLVDAWREIHTAWIMLGRRRRIGSLHALNSMLMWEAARRIMGGMPSLYDDIGLRQLLTHFIGEGATFADMAVPLRVVATDLTHGTRAIFHSGAVIPAVQASSAIPGVFPPVRIGDALYVDGAGLDFASFDAALRLGARRLFVLAIGHDTDTDGGQPWADPVMPDASWARRWGEPHATAAIIERAGQVLGRYHLDQALLQVPKGIETHIISLSTGNGSGMLNFGNVLSWVDRGHDEARAYLRRALPALAEGRPTPGEVVGADGVAPAPVTAGPITAA